MGFWAKLFGRSLKPIQIRIDYASNVPGAEARARWIAEQARIAVPMDHIQVTADRGHGEPGKNFMYFTKAAKEHAERLGLPLRQANWFFRAREEQFDDHANGAGGCAIVVTVQDPNDRR